MDVKLKRWLLIALCCLPPVVLLGLGVATAGATLGVSLNQGVSLGLAALACPLAVAFLFWWWHRAEAD